MYNYIIGKIVKKDVKKNLCVVDVNNIGYEIIVSENTLNDLSEGDIVKFYVVEISSGLYTSGLPTLYGFVSQEEKEIFLAFKENLTNVGPKKALDYLDKIKDNISQFKTAIITKNYKILTSLFGFRTSSAEKIVSALANVELFSKEEIKEGINIDIYSDIVSALTNLGYKEQQVKPVVEKILLQYNITSETKKSTELISKFLSLVIKELGQNQ
jgi:Holliday junction resolvasome RuvABC DNA-binding subunit